jgi:HEAT repeat protein
VDVLLDLLGGADPHDHLEALPALTGLHASALALDRRGEEWPRVWGARGLRYLWDDSAGPAVVDGLHDPAWRVAEMCLKVAWQGELGAAAHPAASLAGHTLRRVRVAALRTLGVTGEHEDLAVVRGAMSDPDPQVRRSAALALSELTRRLDLVR